MYLNLLKVEVGRRSTLFYNILLILLLCYCGISFYFLLIQDNNSFVKLGRWSMFTGESRDHRKLECVAKTSDGRKVAVDLPSIFPARWDSGPAYQRGSFKANKRYMYELSRVICETDPSFSRLIFYDRKYPIVLGVPFNEKAPNERRRIFSMTCGTQYAGK